MDRSLHRRALAAGRGARRVAPRLGRRYALLAPSRTQGGFRLYGEDDVARVLAMRVNLDRGFSAAEAARLALADDVGESSPAPVRSAASSRRLSAASTRVARRLPSTSCSRPSLDVVLRDVLVPYLHESSASVEHGEVSVAQEHFASNLVRGRLMALARSWDSGRRALIACAEGELHDLPLLSFGLVLRGHGWRISYSGRTLRSPRSWTCHDAHPRRSRGLEDRDRCVRPDHDELARGRAACTLYVSGAAATERIAERAHGTMLNHDLSRPPRPSQAGEPDPDALLGDEHAGGLLRSSHASGSGSHTVS